MSSVRHPREKKRLAYSRDHYNRNGESNKGWRKTKPLKKAKAQRAFRRKSNDLLATCPPEETAPLASVRKLEGARVENQRLGQHRPARFRGGPEGETAGNDRSEKSEESQARLTGSPDYSPTIPGGIWNNSRACHAGGWTCKPVMLAFFTSTELPVQPSNHSINAERSGS